MTYYGALDVSLQSVAICIVDDQGAVHLERTVASEVPDIAACLRDFDHEIEVVGFEAGTLTPYLAHGLQSDGFDVICLEARQVNAALSAMRKLHQKRRLCFRMKRNDSSAATTRLRLRGTYDTSSPRSANNSLTSRKLSVKRQ